MQRLLDRRDFLAAAKAQSVALPGVLVQARYRLDDAPARLGFTCTKKLGNAVVRNRVRRRMREAARKVLWAKAQPGFDYVLIGRNTTASRSFEALQKDIISALERIHAASPPRREDRTP
jgi:ribonuclease P protein component